MSQDITFCANTCSNEKCFRHPSNITEKGIPHSFAELKNTPYCPLKDIEDAIEEARREMYRLDDNEDTLKWKGTH